MNFVEISVWGSLTQWSVAINLSALKIIQAFLTQVQNLEISADFGAGADTPPRQFVLGSTLQSLSTCNV
jgi:hypothetical protein